MERNLKIKLPGQTALKKFKINASTFGELKQELKGQIDFNEKRVIIKETKLTLQHDQAILPDYDFMLFLQPLKVKSGYSYVDIDNANYHGLRRMCKEFASKNPKFKDLYLKDSGSYGTVNEMRDALKTGTSVDNLKEEPPVEKDAQTIDSIFEDLNDSIKEVVQIHIENAKERVENLMESSGDSVEEDLVAIETDYNETERELRRENVILPK